MNDYQQLKKKAQQRVEIIGEAIDEFRRLGLVEGETEALWRERLGQVRQSFQDSQLRVGVVGAVKSGKSTLINALAGRDLLKRGAGIVTAFITRIETGEDPGGWVELKSWSQVTEELNATLRLLPLFQEEGLEDEVLDLRREEDRARLRDWIDRTQTEWRQTRQAGGGLDPNLMLLRNFLEGYDEIHSVLGETVNRLILDDRSLTHHQLYAGRECRAVYVRDMELRCTVPWLGEQVEIADCQGSDSPNPAHFALLQQYLLRSHFILYVVNSRIGLREADFKLLDFIKTLRMFPQTLFVVNLDLDVHPNTEDIERLVRKVREELGWVTPNPSVFAFSALYHLLAAPAEDLPERERRHLDIWREDESLVRFSDAGYAAFREAVEDRISGQRMRILLGTGLSRLGMVASSLLDTANAQRSFLDQNLGGLRQSAHHLEKKQKALQGTLGTLQNAISGLRDSLLSSLDESVDRFFDPARGLLVRATLDMVDAFAVDPQDVQDLQDHHQLLRQVYRFYLDFRQSLARYLVERVNLRVIEFAKETENDLQQTYTQSSNAFWSLFATAIEDYRREMADFGIELRPGVELAGTPWPSMEEFSPPSFSAFVDQDAVGRGVLLMKFGLGRVTRFLANLKSRLGQNLPLLSREGLVAGNVEEALCLVKAETKAELVESFRRYRSRFKRDFLHPVLNEGTLHLMRTFGERAQMARLDFENLLRQSEVEGVNRESRLEALTRTAQIAEAMVEELERLRSAVALG